MVAASLATPPAGAAMGAAGAARAAPSALPPTASTPEPRAGPAGAPSAAAGAAAVTTSARSANLLHALSGGVAGALAKTATAPLARLVILYQVGRGLW